MRLRGADGAELLTLEPRAQQLPEMLEVIGHGGWYAETARRSAFNGRVSVITFGRQPRPASSGV